VVPSVSRIGSKLRLILLALHLCHVLTHATYEAHYVVCVPISSSLENSPPALKWSKSLLGRLIVTTAEFTSSTFFLFIELVLVYGSQDLSCCSLRFG